MSATAAGPLQDLLAEAARVLPGGVLGTATLPPEVAFIQAGGQGSRLRATDGREFIDYVLGSGPLVLGHRHPAVVAAAEKDLDSGPQNYLLNEPAIRLAAELVAAVPCAERVRFATSGSEATMYALRFARAFTGRDHIVKFEGGYHGNHDAALQSAWPKQPGACVAAPDSAGIPAFWSEHVSCAVFNDLDTVEAAFATRGEEIAAVLVEPYQRVLAPDQGFLEGLRRLSDEHGAMLVFDETVTGFRLAYGGAQERYGVVPDLATYGKIIGGGFPLSAVVGPAKILDLSSPSTKGSARYVYQSGTLNGQSTACAAGLAALEVLRAPDAYERLAALSKSLRGGIEAHVALRGVAAVTIGETGMWHLLFTDQVPRTPADEARADDALLRRYQVGLLRRGIYVQPGIRSYVSLAHTTQDIERTLELAGAALDAALDDRE